VKAAIDTHLATETHNQTSTECMFGSMMTKIDFGSMKHEYGHRHVDTANNLTKLHNSV